MLIDGRMAENDLGGFRTTKLEVGDIVSNAFSKGLANVLPLFVNALLWALTIWVPYLNVGTTIGLMTGIMGKMAAGEPLSMTEIFNPAYRKYMGQWFLVSIFVGLGVLMGFGFIIIPGIVISISWMFAPILVVNKGMSPMDAIQKSTEMVDGNHFAIFISQVVITILIGIVVGILGGLFISMPNLMFVWVILYFVAIAVALAIFLSAAAYMYQKLSK